MIRVKYLDKIYFMITILPNWSQSNIFKAIPGKVLVFEDFERKIYCFIYCFIFSCSPFKICSDETRHSTTSCTFSSFWSRYLCRINNDGYFLIFLFLLWFFKTFRPLNVSAFFQFIVQFYPSSVKLPHHLCSLTNTMCIWVSFFKNC